MYFLYIEGARWLSGRMSDSGSNRSAFKTYLCRVVPLSKTLYSPKVLVIPRKQWLHPDMTETLLTGTLSLNTNKQTIFYILPSTLVIDKNSAEVDIAPAFGEITTACNVGQAKNGSWCLLEE